MFKRILVAVDGSPESETILAQMKRLASADAAIFLLHVIPPVPVPAGVLPAGQILGLPEHAEAYLKGLVPKLGKMNVTVVVRSGDPSDRILEFSLELNIDLIAMTTHGRTGLSRFLMGSVAEKVVRESSLPVVLVRPGVPVPRTGTRVQLMRRILVPIDGSGESLKILDIVKPWAAARGAEIILVHVRSDRVAAFPFMVAPGSVAEVIPAGDPDPAMIELPRQLLREGFKAKLELPMGEPSRAILGLGRDSDADLIAMATAGRNGIRRIFMGSVAEDVLRESDRPVLLHRVS